MPEQRAGAPFKRRKLIDKAGLDTGLAVFIRNLA